MTCIILAGGKSRRLGRDKTLVSIDGESLIQRVVDRLIPLGSEVIVVASQQQFAIPLAVRSRAKVVFDLYPGKGSLGGIYTGLEASCSSHSLVVACDMPFLNSALLKYMIQLSPAFDLVVPRVGGEIEPLHAIYSKGCLAPIERLLQKGKLKISGFFDAVKVRYVEDDEISRFDPEHLSFFNVNSRADLEKAKVLAKRYQAE